MKIQCTCGAKHEIDVIPEMATRPIRFVCPACGLDSSEFVNELIRRELGQSNPAGPAAPVGVILDSPQVTPAPASGPPVGQPQGSARVRLSKPTPQAAPVSEAPAEEGSPICLKHGGEYALEKCYVCSKPICP